MNNVGLFVLSRYRDLFHGFRMNVELYEPEIAKVLILDGEEIDWNDDALAQWRIYRGPEPFIYARNVNLAWGAWAGHDILLCGDDIRFEGPFVKQLQEAAYSNPKVGVATVQLWGQSPFVCGYFKREVIEAVGFLDERFTGYGKEDNDWFRRMEALGYHTLPTESVKAQHGGGTSFLRRCKEEGKTMEELCNVNNRLFEEKWGA